MPYRVKEIFYTLQGEGRNTGRAAVFCRFAGCNLWSGREEDRATAVCTFCDTDFVGTDGHGGGKFATAEALSRAVRATWPDASREPGAERLAAARDFIWRNGRLLDRHLFAHLFDGGPREPVLAALRPYQNDDGG